jgi:hypothetical protein
MNTNQSQMTQDNLSIVRQFFTDDQWDAIDRALNDYQDYGDDEAEVADTIQRKIGQLFAFTGV